MSKSYNHEWYLKHRERIIAKNLRYDRAHPLRRKERSRQTYQNNKEKYKLMYGIRKITAEQILTVHHGFKEGKRRKEIAEAIDSTVDKVKQIKNTLNLYLIDLKKPSKEVYVTAVKTILREENQEDLWNKMISEKSPNQRYTTTQLVMVWNLREKDGLSFNKINEKMGISQTYMIYENLKRLLEWHPHKLEGASDNYKNAIAIIKGEAIITEENEPQTILTSTIIIKIWQMGQGHFSSRKIAESLGWLTEGSTDYVRVIERNLTFYLAENTYPLIKSRKKPYVDAREYIIKNYPDKIEIQKGIYLRHNVKGDYIEAMPTIMDEEDPEVKEEYRLKYAEKKLTKAVKGIIKDAFIDIQNQIKKVTDLNNLVLTIVEDGDNKGYWLDEIEMFLGERYEQFTRWYQDRAGGILDGRYYVLQKDFEEFTKESKILDKKPVDTKGDRKNKENLQNELWSSYPEYPNCRECHTTNRKHLARGYCSRCYYQKKTKDSPYPGLKDYNK